MYAKLVNRKYAKLATLVTRFSLLFYNLNFLKRKQYLHFETNP
jgi:hypothetical protein